MVKTQTYRVEKLGTYWHVMRLHYVGWWIFKREVWLSEFPYHYYKEGADDMLDELTRAKDGCRRVTVH